MSIPDFGAEGEQAMSEEETSAFESELAMVEGIFCAITAQAGDKLMNLLHKYCEEIALREGVAYNEVTFWQIVDTIAEEENLH